MGPNDVQIIQRILENRILAEIFLELICRKRFATSFVASPMTIRLWNSRACEPLGFQTRPIGISGEITTLSEREAEGPAMSV